MDLDNQNKIDSDEIDLTEDELKLRAAILEKLKNYIPGREKQLADEIDGSLRMIVQ